ncbi:MAG TPA: RodZ domain-containing protein [Terriglobales bacterium]|nr:RodZ domain-containing protein [Terriglobales bacterium]
MMPSSQSKIATAIERENRVPSFGEKLRREREKRSITLDQISESTKIGTRMLQALEEDKFNQLPGGIFNKGFVRAYARHLGLDEDQTVAEYLKASGDAPPIQPELPAEESVGRIEASAVVPQHHLPWGVFAAILLLVALALSIWSHRQTKHEDAATQASPPPPASQQSAQDHAAPIATPPGAAVPSSSAKNPLTPAPVSPTVSPAPQGPPASKPAKTPATAAPKTPSETTTPPAPGEFVVLIQAREDSWTTITADGQTVYSGILSAGDQRAIRGRKEVIVKAGNAGGIDLRFNGKELDRQGDSGQVRTLTFGPGGITANSPATSPIE